VASNTQTETFNQQNQSSDSTCLLAKASPVIKQPTLAAPKLESLPQPCIGFWGLAAAGKTMRSDLADRAGMDPVLVMALVPAEISRLELASAKSALGVEHQVVLWVHIERCLVWAEFQGQSSPVMGDYLVIPRGVQETQRLVRGGAQAGNLVHNAVWTLAPVQIPAVALAPGQEMVDEVLEDVVALAWQVRVGWTDLEPRLCRILKQISGTERRGEAQLCQS
jgi:hypothetical protein